MELWKMEINRETTAYLLNSTPKYYYILELHIVLLKRYGNKMKVFFATEEPTHSMCILLKEKYGVTLLTLEKENSSFLSSRKRALELLPSKYKYVLPMQEDFLLERPIDEKLIEEAGTILRGQMGTYTPEDWPRNPTIHNVPCVRLMPCPGAETTVDPLKHNYDSVMNDTYKFCFQATLWKTSECLKWYIAIVEEVEKHKFLSEEERNIFEVRNNIAENAIGQALFAKVFKGDMAMGFVRKYKASNAVYMSPWPYRPTAIVKGVLQPFAKELAEREGVRIDFQSS